MAEGILKSILQKKNIKSIQVKSCGVMVPAGIGVSANSVEIAAEHGVDISGHVPAQITEQMAEEADLIFVMEFVHKALILSRFPFAKEKVFLLKEYKSDLRGEIADPVGFDKQVYENIFLELSRQISRIFPYLVEENKK